MQDDKLDGEEESNGFVCMADYLAESWRMGRKLLNLWVYFGVGVMGLGGLGIWIAIAIVIWDFRLPDILVALNSFTPAIVGASCLDYIFGTDRKKFLVGFAIAVTFLSFAFVIISFLCKNHTFMSYCLASLAALLALLLWWIDNARNPKLKNEVDFTDAMGGDVNRKLTGFGGDEYVFD